MRSWGFESPSSHHEVPLRNPQPDSTQPVRPPLFKLPAAAARAVVLGRLRKLSSGRLCLQENGAALSFGDTAPGRAGQPFFEPTITVNDPRFFLRVALRGGIGAADSYTRGEWDCDDLVELTRLLAANEQGIETRAGPATALARGMRRLQPAAGRLRSRRNVAKHYDLGNDFFELFLDPGLSYSCLIFDSPATSLKEAAQAKLKHACDSLELKAGQRLLDLGCGWGALSLYAAEQRQVRVTAVTVSEKQADYLAARVQARGLGDLVAVKRSDYRDLRGSHDAVASVEMIEAVGARNYGRLFACYRDRLRPGGRLFLQAITIDDALYDEYRYRPDFIRQRVFPGGCLPSLRVIKREAQGAGLLLEETTDIGSHYVTTLAHWRQRFTDNRQRLSELGYDRALQRSWLMYLSYCEAGFAEGRISDLQLRLRRR